MLPPMLTQPFVVNAIKHGMKDNAAGLIKVNYSKEGSDLIVTVFDNGKAIVDDSSPREYEALGVKITQQRLAIINEYTETSSFMTVNHHNSTDGHHLGKTISLRIKI